MRNNLSTVAVDCVISVDARGKWDVVPEKSEHMAKK